MAERELKVKFTGDTAGLTRSIGAAEKSTSTAGQKIANAGKAIAAGFAVAGAAGVAFAKKSVDTYKNVGGEVAKLKKYTGSSAEDASRLRAAFKLTGIDTDKASTALGKFSKNLATGKIDGFNTSLAGQQKNAKKVEDALGKLADAQQDAADAQEDLHDGTKVTETDRERAAKSLEKVGKAQEKLTDLTKGAGDAMSKLGFKTRDAQGHLLPMSELLPKVADVFEDMPAGAEETALAMELFGTAGADMLPFLNKGADGIAELAKQSDALGTTLTGKDLDAIKESKNQSRLWGLAMEGLQIQVGRYLLPVLNGMMTWVNATMIPGLHAIGAEIVDWVKPKLDAIGQWWDTEGKKSWESFIKWIDTELLPKLRDLGTGALQDFWNIVQAIGDWATQHPDWAVPIATGIGAIALAIKGFGVEMLATPWGIFLTIITGLISAFYTAYMTNDEFRKSVDTTVDDLAAKFTALKDSFINDFITPMQEKWRSFRDDFAIPLGDYLSRSWVSLKETVGGVVDYLKRAWSEFGVFYANLKNNVNDVTNGIKIVWGGLGVAARAVIGFLSGLWNGWVLHFNGVAIRIAGIAGIIKGIWNGIVIAARFVVSILDGIWNGWVLHFNGVAIRIGGIAGLIKGIWNGLYTLIATVIRNIRGIIDGLIGYLEGAVRTIQGIHDRISSIGRSIGDFINKLPGPDIPFIGGNAFVPIPAPPALAAGGIIPGSPWGTLVRAGEGNRSEAIVPLSKMPAGNTYNITVDVAPGSDPVRAGAAVVDAIRSYERVNGQGWRSVPA